MPIIGIQSNNVKGRKTMLLILKQFYRNFVSDDLTNMKMIINSNLLLPKDVVIHYLSESTNPGPMPDEYPLNKGGDARIYMEDVMELSSEVGRPRIVDKATLIAEVRKYRREHKKLYRKLRVPMHELPPTRMGIINYSPILGLYRYPVNNYSDYNRYYNIISTVFQRMTETKKVNMLFIDLTKATMNFTASDIQMLSRLKLDIVKRRVHGLLDSFLVEFVFYILGKDSLINILDNETKALTFFSFNRNGKNVITNLLTMERQLGNIKDTEDIVKRRYVTRKMPILSSSKKIHILDNLFNKTKEDKVEETSEGDDTVIEKDENEVAISLEQTINSVKVVKKDIEKDDIEQINDVLTMAVENPTITPAKKRSLQKAVEQAVTLSSPFPEHEGKPVREVSKISTAEYSLKSSTIDKLPDVISDDMKTSKIKSFDKDYVEKVQDKQVLSVINSFNRAGSLVTDIKVEETGSVLGETKTYTIKFKPLDGEPSTVKIPIPKVDEDGNFSNNGTKYKMSKQHVDLPIRKVSPYEVYLGSYYPSRLAIRRSNKAVDSLERWLGKKIKDAPGANVIVGNVFDHNVKTPNIYAMLASNFSSIRIDDMNFDLNYKNRYDFGDKKVIDKLISKGYIPCGRKGKSNILLIDKDDNIVYRNNKGKIIVIGDIFTVFQLPDKKAPKPLATVKSLGKEYPVVIMLMHTMGITKLVRYLNGNVTVIPSGKRYKESYDIRMRFEDVDVYVKGLDEVGKMILQGMVKLEKLTRLSPYADFERVEPYAPEGVEFLLLELGYPIRYALEIDLIMRMFLDPITIDVLKHMHEPTNMIDLIIRAVDMLKTMDHPSVTDSDYMRERGYERMAGMMYKSVVKAMRTYKTAYNPKKRNINISPYEIFNNIIKDSTVSPTQDINPLATLKESELVTYLGDGGRSRETMVAKSRVFSKSDVGLLSEAVPDSGSTGINAYLSSNPKISNLLGMHEKDVDNTMASLYSTSYLNTPGLDKDNPMRAVMSHIQQSHVVAIEGSRAQPVRTGMEYAIPHKVSAMYANMAESDGKVESITDNGITIKYKDGTTKIYQVGYVEGTSEGKIYPHRLVTTLKVGDKVSKEDTVSYNPNFFEFDPLVGKLLYKQGRDIPMVFLESPETHEDSCALWAGLADEVKSYVLYKLDYTIPFKGGITNLPKVGDSVEAGDIIMIIEDEISMGMNDKSESGNTLQDLTRQAPRTEYSGTIHKIEVLYNGKISDMSKNLQDITRKSDKTRIKQAKERGKKGYTGETFGELRMQGKVIGSDELVVSIYIKSANILNIGDKFVFGSQLKATLGRVFQEPIRTKDGRPAYGMFSWKAASARMAPSAFTTSVANTLLRYIPKYLVNKYLKI